MSKFITYRRVSTDEQGKSGLGLDAQTRQMDYFLRDKDIVGQFVEVASGTDPDRPVLAATLAACREQGAKLVVSTLDRLSRNVQFIATTVNGDVDIVCADMPDCSREMLYMRAVFAEMEVNKIRERTRAALAEKKAQGVKLGAAAHKTKRVYKPRAGTSVGRRQTVDAVAVRQAVMLRTKGQTLQEIADFLNESGFTTSRGGQFRPNSVQRVLDKELMNV